MVVVGADCPHHPAFRAWRQLYSPSRAPAFVEIVQEVKKGEAQSSVYRIGGVGPRGASVIAKRSAVQSAHLEQTVYDEILRHLPVSTLIFYGSLDEPDTGYAWLFLEDAVGAEFTNSLAQHTRLAARWLGRMHTAAARLPATARLPDRGPTHYRQHLDFASCTIQRHLGDGALENEDLRVIDAIRAQFHRLERHWCGIEEICCRFPVTLVHGDFAKYNMRVRSVGDAVDLVAFDWEMAGYGIPGPDIAEASGRGVPRRRLDRDAPDTELSEYWSSVRDAWPELDLEAIKDLAEIGAVFRSLASISWESESIEHGWWPIRELRGYERDLRVAVEQLHLGG